MEEKGTKKEEKREREMIKGHIIGPEKNLCDRKLKVRASTDYRHGSLFYRKKGVKLPILHFRIVRAMNYLFLQSLHSILRPFSMQEKYCGSSFTGLSNHFTVFPLSPSPSHQFSLLSSERIRSFDFFNGKKQFNYLPYPINLPFTSRPFTG